jgi:hypothetical protein
MKASPGVADHVSHLQVDSPPLTGIHGTHEVLRPRNVPKRPRLDVTGVVLSSKRPQTSPVLGEGLQDNGGTEDSNAVDLGGDPRVGDRRLAPALAMTSLTLGESSRDRPSPRSSRRDELGRLQHSKSVRRVCRGCCPWSKCLPWTGGLGLRPHRRAASRTKSRSTPYRDERSQPRTQSLAAAG